MRLSSRSISSLSLYNSLSRSVAPFKQLREGRISWYVCGPTVYDHSHLGHARTYVTFDIMRRILTRYFHQDVLYVMNITDIDDKIIHKAKKAWLLDAFKKENSKEEYVRVKKIIEAGVLEELGKSQRILEDIKTKSEQTNESAMQKKALKAEIDSMEMKIDMQMQAIDTLQKSEGTTEEMLHIVDDLMGEHLVSNTPNIEVDPAFTSEVAKFYEKSFNCAMKALNVLPADFVTRVSEYIPTIIVYIDGIISNGFAYESNGSVYFDTLKFNATEGHQYSKLANVILQGGLASDESTEKKSADDFALWKKAKHGEPSWDSPWGNGRPGWHIECTAMASDIFGDCIDIHSGGEDLKFPHHDNEIAQAEAFHGCNHWVSCFLHSGQLQIKDRKMSKSLKNFILIDDVLKEYSADEVRMFFALQPWGKSISYSRESMEEAKVKCKQMSDFFSRIESRKRNFRDEKSRWCSDDNQMLEHLAVLSETVQRQFLDNLNYNKVLYSVFESISVVNEYEQKEISKVSVLCKFQRFFIDLLDILGFSGFSSFSVGKDEESLVQALNTLCKFRGDVRKIGIKLKDDSLLTLCDQVRSTCSDSLKITLEDTKKGSIWRHIV